MGRGGRLGELTNRTMIEAFTARPATLATPEPSPPTRRGPRSMCATSAPHLAAFVRDQDVLSEVDEERP